MNANQRSISVWRIAGVLIGFTVRLAFKVLMLALRTGGRLAARTPAAAKLVAYLESNATQAEQAPVDPGAPATAQESQPEQYHTVGRDYSNYEPSIPRCVQFPDIGHLTLWAFRGQKVIRRQIVINDEKLAQKLGGKRFPMPDMAWNLSTPLELMEDTAIAEAELFLRNKLAGAPMKPPTRVSSLMPEHTVGAVEVQHQEKRAVKPKAQGKPLTFARLPVHPLKSTLGELQHFGTVDRTIAGKTTQQFAVDVLVPGKGVERLHGADLERAIEQAGAKLGDRVEIRYTGTTEVALAGGGKGHKNLFDARVLA